MKSCYKFNCIFNTKESETVYIIAGLVVRTYELYTVQFS